VRIQLYIAAFLLCGCPAKKDDAQAAKQRIFGKDAPEPALEKRAKEPLDARGLASDATLARRAIGMSWEEVVARLGVVEYRGVAKIDVSRGRPGFSVTEQGVITQGLAGSFHVAQRDNDDQPLREAYYNNGIFFFSSGGGQMRVEGLIRDRPRAMREEVWSPLSTFTQYYGARLGLAPGGEVTVGGRAGVKYQLVLVTGPETIEGTDGDAPKSPKVLKGFIVFDAEKGAPIKAEITGELDVPGGEGGKAAAEPGKIALTLQMEVKQVEALDLKPKAFIPGIERHPLEPDPLAFLDGGTRSSTVIGGKKKVAAPVEPEPEDP